MPSGAGSSASDSIYLTDQMFRDILGPTPNLQVGYLYYFGKRVRTGRLTLDYLLPVSLGRNSAFFGEAHGEFTNFWNTISSIWQRVDTAPTIITTTTTTRSSFNERTDLSLGGGYRKIFAETTLLGVNAFFDSTNLGKRWYSSGGLGFEYAAILPGNDALDLTFNWYGNLFSTDVLADAFRRGPQNFDFQAGYSHELWNGGPDLRLSATGYRFSAGSGVYGFRGGAELKTQDGMFSVKYEAAHDRINQTYHTIGGFVNVGIQLANLLDGESPFVMPEPIFRSPRNIRRRLSTVVRRQWNGPGPPTATASTRAAGAGDCPANACATSPLTPNFRGEFQVYAPATMTLGQFVCRDVPDTTVSFGNVSLFITRKGTKGDLYFTFFDSSNDCTGSVSVGVAINDLDATNCITGFAASFSVHSMRVTCGSPTGCDAGCINFQFWDD